MATHKLNKNKTKIPLFIICCLSERKATITRKFTSNYDFVGAINSNFTNTIFRLNLNLENTRGHLNIDKNLDTWFREIILKNSFSRTQMSSLVRWTHNDNFLEYPINIFSFVLKIF